MQNNRPGFQMRNSGRGEKKKQKLIFYTLLRTVIQYNNKRIITR